VSFDYAICTVAGAIVLIYLVIALLRPEKF